MNGSSLGSWLLVLSEDREEVRDMGQETWDMGRRTRGRIQEEEDRYWWQGRS